MTATTEATRDVVNSSTVKINVRVPHNLHENFPETETTTAYVLRCIQADQERERKRLDAKKLRESMKAGKSEAVQVEGPAPETAAKAPKRKARTQKPEPAPEPVVEAPTSKRPRRAKAKAEAAPEPVAEVKAPKRPRRSEKPAPEPVTAAPEPVAKTRRRRVAKTPAPAAVAEPVKRKPGRPRKKETEAA